MRSFNCFLYRPYKKTHSDSHKHSCFKFLVISKHHPSIPQTCHVVLLFFFSYRDTHKKKKKWRKVSTWCDGSKNLYFFFVYTYMLSQLYDEIDLKKQRSAIIISTNKQKRNTPRYIINDVVPSKSIYN